MFIADLKNGFGTNIFLQTSSEKIRIMLAKAVEFMTNTKDPSHDMDHVNHLLQDANRFFISTGHQIDIDQEVLLLAIYWHDVWKSQIKPSARNYLFQQLYEGLGSMFMFKNYAKTVGLSPRMIRDVSYAIRKHSAIQGFPAKTLEAQLLWDVDILDIWNSKRTQRSFKSLRWTNISLFDSYILYLKKASFHLNFEWTRNEVRKIKPPFFAEMSKFRESLMNRNKRSSSLALQSKVTTANPQLHQ